MKNIINKKSFLLTILLVNLSLPVASMAEAIDFRFQGASIGLEAGTMGFGGNIKGKFNDQIGLRLELDYLSMEDFEVTDEDLKYNFDVELSGILGVVDWHPTSGSFKTSAGLLLNDSSTVGDILPNTQGNDKIEFDFNGEHYSYDISEVGSIGTKVKFDSSVAPYIGIGWDTSFDKQKGFGFTFDLGVAYQGSATASYELKYGSSLDIDERIKNDPNIAKLPAGTVRDQAIATLKTEIDSRKNEIETQVKTDIDKEMVSLQEELDKYKFLPFISIGFNYKF
jgi:hypothetical protein